MTGLEELIERVALPAFITGLATWAFVTIGLVVIAVRALLRALQAKGAGQ